MTVPDATGLDRRPPGGLRGWAWATLVCGTISSVTPVFEGGDRIVEGGFTTVVLLLAMFLPLGWGALDPTDRRRQGVLTGSACFVAVFFLLVTSFVVLLMRSFGEFVSLDVGGVALFATVVTASTTGAIGMRDRVRRGNPSLGDGARWLGAIAGAGVTLGIMLPPPDSAATFSDLNFSFDDGFVQLAWILFVLAAGGISAFGLLSGSRWGTGLAAAGIAPVVWIVVNALFEFDRPSGQEIGVGGVLRNDIHPLLAIATLTVVVVTMASWSRVPAPGEAARSMPEATATPPSPGVGSDDSLRPASPGADATPRDIRAPDEARDADHPPPAPFAVRSMHDSPDPTRPEDADVGRVHDDHTIAADGSSFGPVIVFPDGRRRVVLGTLVVGRDPEARPGDRYPVLIAMGDEDRRMSKTHLAIGLTDSGGLWVEDRNSTNGVLLTPPDATSQPLDPGWRTALPLGSVLVAGATTLYVERQSSESVERAVPNP